MYGTDRREETTQTGDLSVDPIPPPGDPWGWPLCLTWLAEDERPGCLRCHRQELANRGHKPANCCLVYTRIIALSTRLQIIPKSSGMTRLFFVFLFTPRARVCTSVHGRHCLAKIRSDWPKMGQIWDFLRSVSVHFGSAEPKCTETVLKKSRICPIFWPMWPKWSRNRPHLELWILVLSWFRCLDFVASICYSLWHYCLLSWRCECRITISYKY